jgi:outer membrane protein TolC
MQGRRHIVIALAALVAAGVQAETALTTEKAVELAVTNNLSLERSKITADAKKRAADRSWNQLLPTLTARASETVANSDKLSGAADWTPSGALSASVTLSPSIIAGIEKLKLDYEAGTLDYGTAKRSLELSVRETYNQLLLYQAKIDIDRQKLETAKTQYEQTTARAKIGQVPQLEALSARVDWETLKPTLETSILNYETAVDGFKKIIGLPLDETIVLEGKLGTTAASESVKAAAPFGESAAVASLRKSLESTSASKKAVRDSALLPYLSLSYSAVPTYSSALEDWYDAGSFSAVLGLKLDGFVPGSSTQETLDQYDDSIRTIAVKIEEAQQSSLTTIRQLKRTIEKSFSSLEAQKLNVELAEKSFQLHQEAYAKGASDLQSLTTARDTLDVARLSVMQEQYNLANAILELENELNLPFGTIGRN